MDDSKATLEELWQAYGRPAAQGGHDPDVRNLLVDRYFHLVRMVAERVAPELPDMVDRDELIGAGALGLMQAIEKFDHTHGAKFETYCVSRIRGAILDELRNLDWMPRPMRTKTHRAREAFATLVQTLGRNPTDQEMAGNLGLSDAEYTIIATHASSPAARSLYGGASHNSEDDEVRTIDVLQDNKSCEPSQIIERREIREIVSDVIRSLPSTDRLVILLYYYDRLTMKQIGEVLQITESRICQVHGEVLTKLQRRLCARKEELTATGK